MRQQGELLTLGDGGRCTGPGPSQPPTDLTVLHGCWGLCVPGREFSAASLKRAQKAGHPWGGAVPSGPLSRSSFLSPR